MKRPQTKFHSDTMNDSKVLRSESQFIVRSKFSCRVFLFVDILLMLQEHIKRAIRGKARTVILLYLAR